MASYVPWHGKKRATCHRREEDLLRLLHVGGLSEVLLRAAGELREARVRLLRSEYSRFDLGNGKHADRLKKLQTRIDDLSSKDDESILEEYRRKLSSSRVES